jgi:GNAT superfamily N-acetyltransferase
VTIELRELTTAPSDRARLAAFYTDVYEQQFPDPDEREALANIVRYLELKEQGWYGRNNYHVVVAYRGDDVVGGCILDYFDEPNAGVIEFLFAVQSVRGQGIGRQLLVEAERLAGDDARRCGRALQWMAAEMNDPFIAPSVADNMDPFLRSRIWDRWGFAVLDCPYVQPALSRDARPVEGLVLIAKCFERGWRTEVPATRVSALVASYVKWAMRIDVPQDNPQFRALSDWLRPRPTVRRIPLLRYIGEFPAESADSAAFDVIEIRRADESAFQPAIDVYRRAFDSPATSVKPASFVRGLRRYAETGYRYHLWAVRSRRTGDVAGMASFFGFNGMGFGGYIVLEGALRGVGALRPLIARIEQQLVSDALDIHGWLIECENDYTAEVFARCGFYTLDVPYVQPVLPGAVSDAVPPLILMYRPLGRGYGPPKLSRETLLRGLEEVLRFVYRVDDPVSHATVRAVMDALGDRAIVPIA